jgi:hypothetical protein
MVLNVDKVNVEDQNGNLAHVHHATNQMNHHTELTPLEFNQIRQ